MVASTFSMMKIPGSQNFSLSIYISAYNITFLSSRVVVCRNTYSKPILLLFSVLKLSEFNFLNIFSFTSGEGPVISSLSEITFENKEVRLLNSEINFFSLLLKFLKSETKSFFSFPESNPREFKMIFSSEFIFDLIFFH